MTSPRYWACDEKIGYYGLVLRKDKEEGKDYWLVIVIFIERIMWRRKAIKCVMDQASNQYSMDKCDAHAFEIMY